MVKWYHELHGDDYLQNMVHVLSNHHFVVRHGFDSCSVYLYDIKNPYFS